MDELAVVTGAARGIGRAVAEQLGRAGWAVALLDLPERGADGVVAKLQAADVAASFYPCDVGDPDQIGAASRQVKRNGQVRAVINNAGILGPQGPAASIGVAEWDRVMSVNARSAWLMSVAFLDHLTAGSGAVVNLASTAGREGSPGLAAYAASKAAVIALTRTLAKEWAELGVRVNAVAPGLIDTDLSRAIEPGRRQRLIEPVPLGRAGHADEVASVVDFLISDRASYVTGQVWSIDGGRTSG